MLVSLCIAAHMRPSGRLRTSHSSGTSPHCLSCKCALAGAVFEAQARTLGRGNVAAEALVAARSLADAVAATAAASTHGPGVRCAAIEALLWTQVSQSWPAQ